MDLDDIVAMANEISALKEFGQQQKARAEQEFEHVELLMQQKKELECRVMELEVEKVELRTQVRELGETVNGLRASLAEYRRNQEPF